MRVRLYRPAVGRRARCLLAIALLLPGAGFLQAAGVNFIAIAASGALALTALAVVYDAQRPVAVVLRCGILIAGTLGHAASSVSWGEIIRSEMTDGVISLYTRGEALYQIQVDARAARFLNRMVARANLHVQ